jgi:uncharacterized protein (TIGR02246 family)
VASLDETDPQQLADDYCAAYNSGEVELVLAFMTEDAISLSPDQPPVRGLEAHRRFIEAAFARESKRKLNLKSIQSERVGDVLYDCGEWSNTFSSGDGATPRSSSGFYLTVYRQERGAWKFLATTFNFRV